MLSNKTSTTWSWAEDQILEHFILRNRFVIFVLNDKQTNFVKSGNQAVNINHGLGLADIYTYIYVCIYMYIHIIINIYIYICRHSISLTMIKVLLQWPLQLGCVRERVNMRHVLCCCRVMPMNESRAYALSDGTHMHESRHTYAWVTAHMHESRHTYAWVTAHICMSHGTHMHESRHKDTTPWTAGFSVAGSFTGSVAGSVAVSVAKSVTAAGGINW